VTIPDCKNNEGNIVTSTTQKFNAAFSIGGPICTIKTIESLTNVRVDKFVILDFNAFKKVVDALNGVEICLTTPVTDPIRAGGGGTNLDLPAGYSTLNGDQALQFVRARENLGDGSDLSRIDRQQYFIGAMIRDMTKSGLLTNPTLIFEILSAITQSLSTSAEWASLNTLQEFALSIANLKPKNVTMVTTPYQIIENGNVAWSEEATQMWAAIASNRPWPPLTPTATPTPTPTVTPLPAPELVDVYVLNGTSKSGLARTTSNNLETLGFNISDYGNSRERPELTEIRYSAANELKAKSLLSALGQGTLVLDETVLTGVTLIIGKDWSTSTAAPSPVPTLSPTPTPTPTLTTGTTSASDSGCIDAS
jgi:LCP family protein required for cell wall assembly